MIFLTQLRCALGPEELIFVDVTASTHWASEAIEVAGPAALLHAGEQPEHGLGDPRGDRRPARPARPDGRLGHRRRLLPDVGAWRCRPPPGPGLPVKFFVLDDGAYHYMQMLQEPVYRRTTATEIARIDFAAFAAGRRPGLQRDRRQRRRRRRHRPGPRASPARS